MAKLIFSDPQGQPQMLRLDEEMPELVVGRHPDCDLVSEDASVSRRHCTIAFSDLGCEVVDHDSANGTLVNDQRVSRRLLQTLDVIRCGNLQLQFVDDDADEQPPVSPARPLRRFGPSDQGALETRRSPSSSTATDPDPPELDARQSESQGVEARQSEIQRVEALQAEVVRVDGFNSLQAERLRLLQDELALASSRVDRALGQLAESEAEVRELRARVWKLEEANRRVTADDRFAIENAQLRASLAANETLVGELRRAALGGTDAADVARTALAEARADAKAAGLTRKRLREVEAELLALRDALAEATVGGAERVFQIVAAMQDTPRQP